MKKILAVVTIGVSILSCNNNDDKGKFTLSGELKGAANQQIYLEQLYFGDKQPEVLDTAEIQSGKFALAAIAPEEGLYRIRTADSASAFLINEGSNMVFSATEVKHQPFQVLINGPANISLNKLLQYADSMKRLVTNKNEQVQVLTNAGKKQTDSTVVAISGEINSLVEKFGKFVFTYADTAKSPIVSLFAANMAPVEIGGLETPLAKLAKRFPNHKGIADVLAYVKLQAVPPSTQNHQPAAMPGVGDIAPELTMNDVDDKPFSLSQLRGKYVLIDFWASWCGPCRGENPNVVAAFTEFKDKNFTVLGVSLDKNKQAWLDAIKEDKLTWQHISDLKYWNSAAAPLYGFNGIPYNVLIDPQGKIIATDLRESALQKKLTEVLK
jgi:peroxiredoxin